jgi:hypothetical protein
VPRVVIGNVGIKKARQYNPQQDRVHPLQGVRWSKSAGLFLLDMAREEGKTVVWRTRID